MTDSLITHSIFHRHTFRWTALFTACLISCASVSAEIRPQNEKNEALRPQKLVKKPSNIGVNSNTSVAPATTAINTADYIVAVVNQELVTNAELQQRLARIREEALRNKEQQLPPEADLRQQVLDAMIDERVQITNARETGPKIDDAELDRAVANVAAQNQLNTQQLRERLQQQSVNYNSFRSNVKDQILLERVREREVNARIRIGSEEVDALLEQRRAEVGGATQFNLAQILITVPEGAAPEEVAKRKASAEAALARVKANEPFEAVAREISEDGNKDKGGEIGLRPAERLPDVFVDVARALKPGEVAPTLLRSSAGFHAIKLLARQDAGALTVQQTHARHILLRVSPQLSAAAAAKRLSDFKRQVLAGTHSFEKLARESSEDGSAAAGGDLGWASPGTFVPEFEETMNKLAINGISEPLSSRFGVHLIQVMERRQVNLDLKQQREQARSVLREQKFEAAYLEWVRDLRSRAYVELRESPQ
jgi:peptidyl-prolyl cis-trans isomerase SurA